MTEIEQLRKTYREINDSFSETLVFHCGASAGIFSEINGMLGFMAYCLKHRIRFTMYSDDANFAREGWQSFFLPFCPECHESFHHHYNHRLPRLGLKNEILKSLQFFPKRCLKRKFHFDYLTYELWDKVFAPGADDERLDLPELGMTGTTRDALPILLKIVWNFNERTRSEIGRLTEKALPQEDFAGFQLRFGDKDIEAEVVGPSRYLELAGRHSDLRRAFILTDDYEAGFLRLKQEYPDGRFSTLTPETDRGYSLAGLNRRTEADKRAALIMLFASVEILIRSRIFCGMLSANPSRFVWIARNYRDSFFVDVPEE